MPEIKNYSQWSADNALDKDPIDALREYTDYARMQYLRSGAPMSTVEPELRAGIEDKLKADGLLSEETTPEQLSELQTRLFAPKTNLDFDAAVVQNYLALDDPDSGDEETKNNSALLRDYLAKKKYSAELAAPLEGAVKDLLQDSALVRRARVAAVDRGEYNAIAVTEDDGTRNVYAGSRDLEDSEIPMVAESLVRSGALDTSDIVGLQDNYRKVFGGKSTLNQNARSAMFNDVLDSLSKTDPEIADILGGAASAAAKQEALSREGFVGKAAAFAKGSLAAPFVGFGEAVGAAMGLEQPKPTGAEIAEYQFRQGDSTAAEMIRQKLLENPAMRKRFSEQEITAFTNDRVLAQTDYKFDNTKPESGLRQLSTGEVNIAPALLVSPQKLEDALGKAPLNEEQKEFARKQRAALLDVRVPQMLKLIASSSDEAVSAYATAKQNGVGDREFVEQWLSNEGNYGMFSNTASSLAYSGIQALGSVPIGIASLLGSETATTIMLRSQAKQARYAEYGALFGDEFGLTREALTALPAVAVDIALTIGTAGVGRAASAAARAGSMSARTLAKGAVGVLDDAALAAVRGASAGAAAETSAALQAAGRSWISKAATTTVEQTIPVALPAFTRSASSTYVSIYGSLPEDMTHEEKHKQAIGFALAAGVGTAAITAGLSALGFAGVEKLGVRTAAKGLDDLTYREAKVLFETVKNEGKAVSDVAFQKALAAEVGAAFRNLTKTASGTAEVVVRPLLGREYRNLASGVVKGFRDEAFEEALDQSINMAIEDAALKKNRPLAEKLQQVWNAGLIGGVLGGGINVASQAFTPTASAQTKALQQRTAVLDGIAKRLSTSGAPETAASVQRMMDDANAAAAASVKKDTAAAATQAAAATTTAVRTVAEQLEFKFDDPRGVPPADTRLADLIGERVYIGDTGINGIAEIDANTGEVVINFSKPTKVKGKPNVTRYVLGTKFQKATGVTLKPKIKTLTKAVGALPVGTRTFRSGKLEYVLPTADAVDKARAAGKPLLVLQRDEKQRVVGVTIRGAALVVSPTTSTDATITDPDLMREVLRLYPAPTTPTGGFALESGEQLELDFNTPRAVEQPETEGEPPLIPTGTGVFGLESGEQLEIDFNAPRPAPPTPTGGFALEPADQLELDFNAPRPTPPTPTGGFALEPADQLELDFNAPETEPELQALLEDTDQLEIDFEAEAPETTKANLNALSVILAGDPVLNFLRAADPKRKGFAASVQQISDGEWSAAGDVLDAAYDFVADLGDSEPLLTKAALDTLGPILFKYDTGTTIRKRNAAKSARRNQGARPTSPAPKAEAPPVAPTPEPAPPTAPAPTPAAKKAAKKVAKEEPTKEQVLNEVAQALVKLEQALVKERKLGSRQLGDRKIAREISEKLTGLGFTPADTPEGFFLNVVDAGDPSAFERLVGAFQWAYGQPEPVAEAAAEPAATGNITEDDVLNWLTEEGNAESLVGKQVRLSSKMGGDTVTITSVEGQTLFYRDPDPRIGEVEGDVEAGDFDPESFTPYLEAGNVEPEAGAAEKQGRGTIVGQPTEAEIAERVGDMTNREQAIDDWFTDKTLALRAEFGRLRGITDRADMLNERYGERYGADDAMGNAQDTMRENGITEYQGADFWQIAINTLLDYMNQYGVSTEPEAGAVEPEAAAESDDALLAPYKTLGEIIGSGDPAVVRAAIRNEQRNQAMYQQALDRRRAALAEKEQQLPERQAEVDAAKKRVREAKAVLKSAAKEERFDDAAVAKRKVGNEEYTLREAEERLALLELEGIRADVAQYEGFVEGPKRLIRYYEETWAEENPDTPLYGPEAFAPTPEPSTPPVAPLTSEQVEEWYSDIDNAESLIGKEITIQLVTYDESDTRRVVPTRVKITGVGKKYKIPTYRDPETGSLVELGDDHTFDPESFRPYMNLGIPANMRKPRSLESWRQSLENSGSEAPQAETYLKKKESLKLFKLSPSSASTDQIGGSHLFKTRDGELIVADKDDNNWDLRSAYNSDVTSEDEGAIDNEDALQRLSEELAEKRRQKFEEAVAKLGDTRNYPEVQALLNADDVVSQYRLIDYANTIDPQAGTLSMLAPQGTRPPVMSIFAPEALSGANTGYKSRSVVVEMRIDDFLKYALPLPSESRRDARDSFDRGVKWESLPALMVDDSNRSEVRISGHEGRHRALVLKEAGYDTMPVEIRSTSIRWSEQDDPSRFDYKETLPTEILSEDGTQTLPYPATRKSYVEEKGVIERLTKSTGSLSMLAPQGEALRQNIADIPAALRGMLPAGFTLVADPNMDGALGYNAVTAPTTVFYNPNLVGSLTVGLARADALATLRTAVDHELGHAAAEEAFGQDGYESLAVELGEDMLTNIASIYYSLVEPDFNLRAERIKEDRESGALPDWKIAAEWVRMEIERIANGRTSEQRMLFLRSRPSLLAKFIDALGAFVTRLRARFFEQPTTGTAASISNAARQLRKMRNGGYLPAAPKADLNYGGHAAELIGAIERGSDQTLFTMPIGAATAAGRAQVEGLWTRIGKKFQNLPPYLRDNKEERDGIMALGNNIILNFNKRFSKLTKENPAIPIDDIRTVLGRTDPTLDNAALAQIQTELDAFAGALPFDMDTVLAEEMIDRERDRLQQRERLASNNAFRQEQQSAEQRIRNAGAPALADLLVKFRTDINNMSARFTDLSPVIDENMGIYLTRTYRFHNTEGWSLLAKGGIQPDGSQLGMFRGKEIDFAKLRDNAARTYEQDALAKAAKDGVVLTAEQLRARTHGMLDEYLAKLQGSAESSPSPSQDSLQKDLTKLMPKGNINKEIMELLGVVEDPLENAVRTMVAVTKIAANNTFLRSTYDTLLSMNLASTKQTPEMGVKALRVDRDGSLSPLSDLFTTPEIANALQAEWGVNARNAERNTDSVMREGGRALMAVASFATTTKTLFSFGFYPRNAVSGQGLLLSAQGILPINKYFLEAYGLARRAYFESNERTPEQDAMIQRLIELQVLADDTQGRVAMDIMRGFVTDNEQDLDALLRDFQEATEGKPKKLLDRIGESLPAKKYGRTVDILASLNNWFDGAVKTQAYMYELDVLKKDNAAALAGDPLLLAQLELRAADKVKMTMPSHSRQLPIVKSLNQTSVGMVFFPFARWKTEVFRTMYNTPRLALKEIREGGPAEKARGYRRMFGFTSTLLFGGSAVGTVYAGLFRIIGGILGEDEEKKDARELTIDELYALRESLPVWQRGHALHTRLVGGQVQVIDMTAITPYAQLTDLFVITHEGIVNKESDWNAKRTAGYVAQQLIGTQIAATALNEALNNSDDFGQPIYRDTDNPVEVTGKILAHFGGSALKPAALDQVMRATRSGEQDRWEIITGELLGARPRNHKMSEIEYRAFRGVKKMLDDSAQIKASLVTGRKLDEDEVVQTLEDHQESLNRTQRKLAKVMQGLQSMGSTRGGLYGSGKNAGFSAQRLELAEKGDNLRWVPNQDWLKGVYQNMTRTGEDDPMNRIRLIRRTLSGMPATYGVSE